MAKNVQFGSKVGMIAATVGSAVGLGNIWRFPAEVQTNGGAAFLLIYIVCVLLLGIPVMLGEFAIGRAGKSDAVGVFKKLGARKPWWAIGAMGVLASYLILCFYMVVAGWTLEYLIQSVTGGLFSPLPEGSSDAPLYAAKMNSFISKPVPPLINTYLMIAINLGVLLAGVQKGIERMSNIMMPMLFVILLILCFKSMSLPNASAGLDYFLKPDFSKITPGVIVNALGQAFFSLSLGMGILITYSSYYPNSANLTRTAFTVSALDMLVAVLVGMTIFPAITSFGLQGENLEGASLVFITLPEVFEHMALTRFWAILFFTLLTMAALTSTISIAEVSVAFIRDRFKIRRWKACLWVLAPLMVFSTLCSLSMGPLDEFKILGLNLFNLLDTIATNFMLPIGSFFLCIYLGWFAPPKLLRNQLTNNGELRSRLAHIVMFIIRYFAPFMILTVFVSYFL